MARNGKKSVYLDEEAVDKLKELVANGFEFKGIKLNTISQVILALIQEHKQKD